MKRMGDDFEICTSRTGRKTVKYKGQALHSLYDPEKEAKKFLEQYTFNNSSCIILIGTGLGYIDYELIKNTPCKKIISLHANNLAHISELAHYISHRYKLWTSTNQISLLDFLNREMGEIDLSSFQIIIWPAMLQIDPTIVNVINYVKQHIEQLKGNLASLQHFGWRWINNIVQNFIHWDLQYNLPKVNQTFIAASGPSLYQALPFLKQYRSHFYLIALPSSITFLQYYNIKPDLIVATDGGYYAGQHLAQLTTSPIIAMPTVAYPIKKNSISLFSFDTFIEKEIFSSKFAFIPKFSWNGTVAANALQLAENITTELIILAGQDFSHQDLYLHVQPHTFGTTYLTQNNRFLPLHQIYQQAIWNSKNSLQIYSKWFKNHQWGSKIVRIYPSVVDLSIKTSKPDELQIKKFTYEYLSHTQMTSTKKERIDHVIKILKNWIEKIDQSDIEDEEIHEILLYLVPSQLLQYLKADKKNKTALSTELKHISKDYLLRILSII
jgi:hypothetical protein